MTCPYCSAVLSEGSPFCPECGQSFSSSLSNSGQTGKYWNDVDALNEKNERERLGAIQRAKDEMKQQTAGFLRKALMVGIVVAILALILWSLNNSNQKKLEIVRADAIGSSYSDSSTRIMSNGDNFDQMIVMFKDDRLLTYTHGNYTMHISSSGSGNRISVSENEIYQKKDYEYRFRSTLFGKVLLEFNGNQYEVELKDDGTIFTVHFYSN